MISAKATQFLTCITITLAFIVVLLGAYTRLSNAGLGCPDWPGCYGRIVVPQDERDIAQANQIYPDRPLEQAKAWKEMIHRYAAGMLGILILTLTVFAWMRRSIPGQQIWVPTILLGLVIFQALLGMWTVTLLLKPIVVVAHLLGGMTILLLLLWTLLAQAPVARLSKYTNVSASMYHGVIIGLVVLFLQIVLGGWTSANYAALICADFPLCQGQWWPPMNFVEGFMPWRGLGVDYEGGVLDVEARTAVHMSHRVGALITLFVVGTVAVRACLDSHPKRKFVGAILLILLLTQFGLGIANVLLFLPLPTAVAHNAVAALLLLTMGALLFYVMPRE